MTRYYLMDDNTASEVFDENNPHMDEHSYWDFDSAQSDIIADIQHNPHLAVLMQRLLRKSVYTYPEKGDRALLCVVNSIVASDQELFEPEEECK